jgi:hypothetical protein
MRDPTAERLRLHWRNSLFLLVFAAGALAWLAVVGWVVWLVFHPVTDWIGRQNEFVQEILGTLVVCAFAVIVALGVGGASHVAEGVAGLRPGTEPSPPGPLPAGAKRWARGRHTLPAAPEPPSD